MHIFGNSEERYQNVRDNLRSLVSSGSIGGVSLQLQPVAPSDVSVFLPYTEMPMYDGPIDRELNGGSVPSEKMVLAYVTVDSDKAVELMATLRGGTPAEFRRSADDAHVEELRQAIQAGGVPIPPVHIDVDGSISSQQEGRHRVIAAAADHDTVELLLAQKVRR